MDIVDFHTHIIPRADHGSSSTATSVYQLNLANKYGVKRIIATPHFYPFKENPDNFLQRRNACYHHLKERLLNEYPAIKLGAEILICDNIEEMPMLDALCIEGTKALLIELPFTDFFDSYVTSINLLVKNGYTVILAHADRYDPNDIKRLIAVGAYVQLNADALCGLFIPKHIKRWLNDNRVAAIGSDIHGEDKKAYRRFNKAIKRLKKHIDFIKSFSDSIWNQ